ncbi:MAG: hypothetical protein N4A32_09395 [Marinifilaceae bacterium]|nr:hypothetical protein [Marinifilaceae bacterium]
MKSNKKSLIIKRIYSLILLSLVSFLLVNNVAYLHTHYTSDGEYITHAHPYNTSSDSAPIKTHHHSKFEYSLFKALHFFIISSTLILAVITAKNIFIHNEYRYSYIYTCIEHEYRRGPPSISKLA